MSTDTKERKNEVAAAKPQGKLLARMAEERGIDAGEFYKALCATVMPSAAKQEDIVVFLLLCERYGFDPFAKHLYAFPGKSGGIQPVVSVDGWVNIANNHEQFDGMEYADTLDNGELISITCRIHRKDRSFPVCCTEYMDECRGTSEPWKRWPRRMLRHKATIQAIRMAFGISGLVDDDEFQRIEGCTVTVERDTKRIREVPRANLSTPNGTRGVQTTADFRKVDIPPGIIDALSGAVDAGETGRVLEIKADACDGADGELLSRIEHACDAALAEIERKGKTQKELV